MSGRDGNPHIRDAAHYIDEASQINAWDTDERTIIATNAQAIATLALAYEQRTANLIAAWGTEALLNSTQVAEQQLAIRARLGITERTTP